MSDILPLSPISPSIKAYPTVNLHGVAQKPPRNRKPTKYTKSSGNNSSGSSPYYGLKHQPACCDDNGASSKFVWWRKEEKESTWNLSRRRRQKLEERRARDRQEELRRVQEARKGREEARQAAHDEQENDQRERGRREGNVWQQQEEDFFLKQIELRTRLRIEGRRAQPIDKLAWYATLLAVYFGTCKFKHVQMHIPGKGPCGYLDGLTVDGLQDLIADIALYQKVHADRGAIYRDFWKNILSVATHELRLMEEKETKRTGHGRLLPFLNERIADDIFNMFHNKTREQLELMLSSIQNKVSIGGDGLDVGYWEGVTEQLRIQIAHRSLLENHERFIKKSVLDSTKASHSAINDHSGCIIEDHGLRITSQRETVLPQDAIVQCAENENIHLIERRRKGMAIRCSSDVALAYSMIAPASPDVDDELGGKYTPRKPLYHNSVHTGFVWNKYNRTHYDSDNPPPKTIHGYKFNIFYPDLINKAVCPQYSIIPCDDDPNTAILRFHAGPPYQDIAFRVLNRKWDRGHRRDFRDQFDGNILQIWFRFKRQCYRR